MAALPRTARETSDSLIYHVMLRGNNREPIFTDNRDIDIFLQKLAAVKEKFSFKIYGFCFMVNHVHLCLKESESGLISKFMHDLETSYVAWYNIKHTRCGHLFQGRFKSKPVESSDYLVNVIRYIHLNPVNAGMCKYAADYVDSSYGAYVGNDPGLIDRDDIFDIIAPDEFAAFHEGEIDRDDLKFLKMPDEPGPRVAKEDAVEAMQSLSGCMDGLQMMGLGMDKVFEIIKKFRQKGLSYRQIADFIKRGKSTVYRWANACQEDSGSG